MKQTTLVIFLVLASFGAFATAGKTTKPKKAKIKALLNVCKKSISTAINEKTGESYSASCTKCADDAGAAFAAAQACSLTGLKLIIGGIK